MRYDVIEGVGIGIDKSGQNNSAEDVSKKAKEKRVDVEDDKFKEQFMGDKGESTVVEAVVAEAVFSE